MKKFLILFLSIFGLFLGLISCGSKTEQRPKFVKSPVDNIITKYIDKSDYSVILADMDYREDIDKYYHKYQILIQEEKPKLTRDQLADTTAQASDIKIETTDWLEVSPIVFEDYQNDLGMTILSKENGVLDKNSAPAGANGYVGNPQYGQWQTHSNGSSFWIFYGRYRLMSDLFFGPRYGYGGYYGYPRSDWNDYRRNYRGRTDYYGKNNQYGTRSKTNTNTSWNKKPSDFKSKVRSKVAQSSSSLKSRGYTSSKSYSKTTRNANRFSSSSSSRGRSGGFGK
ncbi:hypothetical protein [Aquimarina agarivorans]|uniref:hypothetical protein n=1 Tax=Aquimarina agarivorans TaxID=980584 RepID=UPI000248F26D|nr:hypothetical protein [Aquimarina agarivorans]